MADASLLAPALDQVRAEIDAFLSELLAVPPDPRARLYEAMRYAAIGGGKRLRPLARRRRLGAVPHRARERAVRVGAAVECIHVYSLIHDDLPCMDDDDLRRGKPTVHKAFDEATAILAGDASTPSPSRSSPTRRPTRIRSSAPSWSPSWPARRGRRAWPAGR